MTCDIRQAGIRDIKTLAELDKLCFAVPWSEESFTKDIRDNDLAFYLAAEMKGEVVGYAGLWKIGDEGHITNVAVRPDCRKNGIARQLMSRLLKDGTAKGICQYTLEVRISNTAAISLYNSLGFAGVGLRKGYYTDTGEDAIIMWR